MIPTPETLRRTTCIAQVSLGDDKPNVLGEAVLRPQRGDAPIDPIVRVMEALAIQGWRGVMFRSLTGPIDPARDGTLLKWTTTTDLFAMGIDVPELAEWHDHIFGTKPRVWIGGSTMVPTDRGRQPILETASVNIDKWTDCNWAVGLDAPKQAMKHGATEEDFGDFIASLPPDTWAEDCGEWLGPQVHSIRVARNGVSSAAEYSAWTNVLVDETCSVAMLNGDDWPRHVLNESLACEKRVLVMQADSQTVRRAVG